MRVNELERIPDVTYLAQHADGDDAYAVVAHEGEPMILAFVSEDAFLASTLPPSLKGTLPLTPITRGKMLGLMERMGMSVAVADGTDWQEFTLARDDQVTVSLDIAIEEDSTPSPSLTPLSEDE